MSEETELKPKTIHIEGKTRMVLRILAAKDEISLKKYIEKMLKDHAVSNYELLN